MYDYELKYWAITQLRSVQQFKLRVILSKASLSLIYDDRASQMGKR